MSVRSRPRTWCNKALKDLPLQKRCLKLMKEGGKPEVEPGRVAQLTDIVPIAEQSKQFYGADMRTKGGVLKP
jgi:hypothetical protein